MKAYITFGQVHIHSINGKTFDKDTVALLNVTDKQEAVYLAEKLFGKVYCGLYTQQEWNEDLINYYPKGYVELQN